MLGNPVESGIKTYGALEDIKNNRKMVNAQVEAINANTNFTKVQTQAMDQRVEMMQFELNQMKKNWSISRQQEGLYDYQLTGNAAMLNDHIDSDPTFKENLNKLGIQKFVNAKQYLPGENMQQAKRQIALMNNVPEDQIDDFVKNMPDSRVGMIVDMDGNLQIQDTDMYDMFVPGMQTYKEGRAMQRAQFMTEIEKQYADIDAKRAETAKTAQEARKKMNVNDLSEYFIDAISNDKITPEKADTLMRALQSISTGNASAAYKPNSQETKKQMADSAFKAEKPFTTGESMDKNYGLPSGTTGANALLEQINAATGGGYASLGEVPTNIAIQFANADKNNTAVVEDARAFILRDKNTKEANDMLKYTNVLEAIKSLNPRDVGIGDQAFQKAYQYIEDAFGQNVFSVKNKEALVALAHLGTLMKRDNRTGGYMNRDEVKTLLALQPGKQANYKQTLSSLSYAVQIQIDNMENLFAKQPAAKIAFAKEYKNLQDVKAYYNTMNAMYSANKSLADVVLDKDGKYGVQGTMAMEDGTPVFIITGKNTTVSPEKLEEIKKDPNSKYKYVFDPKSGTLINAQREALKL